MKVERIPTPNGQNHQEILEKLQEIVSKNKVVGFIYEPLIQGAAGMKIHDANGLNEILNFFKTNNILTIADEVMTGFGKTGRNFASDFIETKPDIICLSKALTGGLVPLAITSCTEKIYTAFLSNEMAKGFFHCHTYSANPIACTAANAAIELLQTHEIQQKIKEISASHKEFQAKIIKHPKVKTARSQGVIFALDLDTKTARYGSLRDKLLAFFMERGVFLRPLGNTIYIQVPYVITKKELQKVYNTIEESLEIV
jgi:adenosylmethionine-8-amino-7-oxononanoate aminotransferase